MKCLMPLACPMQSQFRELGPLDLSGTLYLAKMGAHSLRGVEDLFNNAM